MTEMPFADNSFDAITCVGAIWHLKQGDEKKFLEEAYRVLKPGGTLVVTPEISEKEGVPQIYKIASPVVQKKIRLLDFTPSYTESLMQEASLQTQRVKLENWRTEVILGKKKIKKVGTLSANERELLDELEPQE